MPRDEAENARFQLLPDGEYSFKVVEAQARTSSKGNPMISLKLCVWDKDGREHLLFDYLVNTSMMEWKTIHFCDAVGLTKEYDSGNFTDYMCLNKVGKAKIETQGARPKPDGSGSYGPRNVVADYIRPGAEDTQKFVKALGGGKKEQKAEQDFTDDDIPF
jgi:hypothetical protein